jgi:hypothetical protein
VVDDSEERGQLSAKASPPASAGDRIAAGHSTSCSGSGPHFLNASRATRTKLNVRRSVLPDGECISRKGFAVWMPMPVIILPFAGNAATILDHYRLLFGMTGNMLSSLAEDIRNFT